MLQVPESFKHQQNAILNAHKMMCLMQVKLFTPQFINKNEPWGQFHKPIYALRQIFTP